MMFKTVLIMLSVTSVHLTSNQYSNKFEVTQGCFQYDSKHGYYYSHPYFSTADYRHIRTDNGNVTEMRMGVLAKNDGYVRLSPVKYPYDNTPMVEIVLSGWGNTRTVARQYIRNEPSKIKNTMDLKEKSTVGLLSEYGPLMFSIAVHKDGLVELTRDDDNEPFLEFRKSNMPVDYVSFCNWDVPAIYFFDCPLKGEIGKRDGISHF